MTEYIIAEIVNNEKFLHCLAGIDIDYAIERLDDERLRHPDKKLIIDTVVAETAWWNTIGTH